MVQAQPAQGSPAGTEGRTLHPVEPPDEDVAYGLFLLKPILETTIQKLYELGRPGWADFCLVFYETISDVMTAGNAEE